MKTKSILLLVLIASAMIKVFVYFCTYVFMSVLIPTDPGPFVGGVQAFLSGDGGQEPRRGRSTLAEEHAAAKLWLKKYRWHRLF